MATRRLDRVLLSAAQGMLRDYRLRRRGQWILWSALIGTLSGVGAILFDLAFRATERVLLHGVGRFRPPGEGAHGLPGIGPDNPWLLPLSLVAGGLVAGLLVFLVAPEAEGHGTDAVLKAFHHLKGRIRRRVPVVKALASAITIGSGGSAGREGPIAQIGAGIGSALGDLLRLSNHDRRILMMAGVAGGIGSIFRAPLGAALFSAECLYSKPDFEYEVLLPGLISAITGYSIYSSYAGWGVLFEVPRMAFHEPSQLPVYAVLGVACALLGAVYPRVFYGMRDRIFAPLKVPAWLKPAIGAAALGLVAVVFPQALGMGYGYIQEAIDGMHGWRFLLAFAGIKMLATSLTISSGGSGGVFGPSLVIGGALGAAFGEAAQIWVPSLAPPPAACIMVGMCGFFAGVAKVPFASVIMVMELTGSYGLLVPSLLVAAIAYLALPLRVKLYENQVGARNDSPAHLGSFTVDILRHVTVGRYWKPDREDLATLSEATPLADVVASASDSDQDLFPVLDREGRLIGELSLDDIRRAVLQSEKQPEPISAGEVATPPVGPLHPEDTLDIAARVLASRRTDAVLVTSGDHEDRLLGLFSRRDLIFAYSREMERMRQGSDTLPGEHEPF